MRGREEAMASPEKDASILKMATGRCPHPSSKTPIRRADGEIDAGRLIACAGLLTGNEDGEDTGGAAGHVSAFVRG